MMMIMMRISMVEDEEMSAMGFDDEDRVDWIQCQEEDEDCADNLNGKQ